MTLKKVDSIALAEYILAKVGTASHLKLQKLVYYCEAYHLAYFEQSIVDDVFEAWLHGPVTRKLWNHLKCSANVYDSVALKEPKSDIIKSFEQSVAQEQKEFIDDVIEEFGRRSAYHLECLTHREPPWKLARKGYADDDKCTAPISKEEMKKYYRKQLYQ